MQTECICLLFSYSAKTTVWETINGKFIPPPGNQGWENGAFWRFNLDLGGTGFAVIHLMSDPKGNS